MKLIRDLVREEIAKILNDDVLVQTRIWPSDYPGLVDDDDESLGDFSMLGNTNIDHDEAFSAGCSVCGDKSGQCDHPDWSQTCSKNNHDDEKEHNHNKKSYMARPQLSRISKYATELLNMIKDGEEVDDWIESYIAQSEQMIDAVYGKYEFKNSKHH